MYFRAITTLFQQTETKWGRYFVSVATAPVPSRPRFSSGKTGKMVLRPAVQRQVRTPQMHRYVMPASHKRLTVSRSAALA
jgi:hypothetical protein